MNPEEDLPRSWVSRLLLLLAVSGWLGVPSIPATAQGRGDAIDLVLIADRSGRAPGPGIGQAMTDVLLLWAATAAPTDRLLLLRGGPSPRMVGGALRMRDPDDRAAFRALLRRLSGFDGGEANWPRMVDLSVRSLSQLPEPAPFVGLLALARADPKAAEALAGAAARLAGPPARPLFALGLEQSLSLLDQTLGQASGGAATTRLSDPERYEAALRLWGALSPHRWTTWISLPPGLEQRLVLPPGAAWAAFVLVRPTPSARLVTLVHEDTNWLGPAAQARIDVVRTERLEIVTLLPFGSYEGEWRIRMEGDQEARLGVVVSLREPLLLTEPGPSRRLLAPSGAPIYLEATLPQRLSGAALEWQAGEIRAPLRDDGGDADREGGDGRAGGLIPAEALSGRVEGAFRLSWAGGVWEQPVWLDRMADLPALEAQAPTSPAPGMPITVTVPRPPGVEEVRWRWVGWRVGNARYQPPERMEALADRWEWVFRPPAGGPVRFLALGEVRALGPAGPRVYPQAVVADLQVGASTEGRLFVALERSPRALNLPGELTLIITSTLDRSAQLRLEVVEEGAGVQVAPSTLSIPAREIVRRKIRVSGEGIRQPREIRIRAREEKGAPVEGGEWRLTVAAGGDGGFSPIWLCLIAAAGAGGFVLIRVLLRRSREQWP